MVVLKNGSGTAQVVKVVEHVYGEGEAMDPGSALDEVVVLQNGKEKTIGVDDIKEISRARNGPSVARSAGRKRKTRRGKSKKGGKRHHRKTRAHRRR
jgi:hypothetical protein